MSGLLVKSTLIMRENLVELNERSLADVPVLLGGAALTRTYVERDLREVYDGRLFYGRDAFEGLRTMDRLVELKRTGEEDPLLRPRDLREERARGAAVSTPRTTTPVEGQPDRSGVAADNPLFMPPFVGTRVAKGIALDDIAEYLNLTALFRNQWGFRPEDGRGRPDFKDRVKADTARAAEQGQGGRPARAAVAYGHFAANAEGNDLVIWKDETRTAEWMRFSFPRQRKEPWLCIADFFRPTGSGDEDFASFMLVHHRAAGVRGGGAPVRREPLPGVPVPARPRRRDGRGDGRVLAPPHPRGARLRRRGRADARRAVPPAVPRRPLLVGLPGLPGPRRQRQGGRAPRRGPHRRRRSARGSSCTPSRRPTPSSATTPRPSTSSRRAGASSGSCRAWRRPMMRPSNAVIARAAALLVVGLAQVLALSPAAGAATAPLRHALGAIVLSHLGAGYIVTAQGPLVGATSAPGSPDADGAGVGVGALTTAGGSVETYPRSWRDTAGVNTARDLVVRFSTAAQARAAVGAARRALARGEVAGSGALAGVPGAQRTTYLRVLDAGGDRPGDHDVRGDLGRAAHLLLGGVGQREIRSRPPTPAAAARAQYAAMAAAAGQRQRSPRRAACPWAMSAGPCWPWSSCPPRWRRPWSCAGGGPPRQRKRPTPGRAERDRFGSADPGRGRRRLAGVVARAGERRGLDVAMPSASPAPRRRSNSAGAQQRATGRWSPVGRRYWPMVTMSTPTPRRSARVATTSSSVSPMPTIRPDLVVEAGRLGPGQHAPGCGRSRPTGAPPAAAGPPSRCCG